MFLNVELIIYMRKINAWLCEFYSVCELNGKVPASEAI